MSDLRKAATMALDAIQTYAPDYMHGMPKKTYVKALQSSLAQPNDSTQSPLTNGEIYTAYIKATNQTLRAQDEKFALAFARAVEQAHGIGGKDEQ